MVICFVLDVEMNASSSFAYTVDTWHSRLGNFNVKNIKRMHSMNLIPKLIMSEMRKCQVCVEAKYHKKSFKEVTKR